VTAGTFVIESEPRQEASGWPASKGWFNGYRVGGGAGSFLPHDHAEPAF
jgi:hypothetical protein